MTTSETKGSNTLSIQTSEQFESLKNLGYLVQMLGCGGDLLSNVIYMHGDEWETCNYCEYPFCECSCDRGGAYSSPYDDEASFE